MIDHVSVSVRDLAASVRFYEQLLGVLGFTKLRDLPASVGFGKQYPEFWLNHRPQMQPDLETGVHVALRAPDRERVDRFYAEALRLGATSDLAPHVRRETYYAAFVRDPDGNRIEAVTFLQA
ncbi:MAG: VOC family protein [Bradyrhizobiaceae bacterium]|nr:VOC family protein [Bradyrhizobiaceae bacterium]